MAGATAGRGAAAEEDKVTLTATELPRDHSRSVGPCVAPAIRSWPTNDHHAHQNVTKGIGWRIVLLEVPTPRLFLPRQQRFKEQEMP